MEWSHGNSTIHFIQCMNVDLFQTSNQAPYCRMHAACCLLPAACQHITFVFTSEDSLRYMYVSTIHVKMTNTICIRMK